MDTLKKHSHYTNSMYKLYSWIDTNGSKGWDPYDALDSRLLNALTLGNKWLRLMAVQFNRISFLNLRRAFGIKRRIHPKTLTLLSKASMNFFSLSKNIVFLENTEKYLQQLQQMMAMRSTGCCWGPHRSYQTRNMNIQKGEPAGTFTAMAGNTFLDAFEITGNKRYLEIAIGCADFLVNEMLVVNRDGYTFFRYTLSANNIIVYNTQALIAAFFARIFKHTGNEHLQVLAFKAVDLLVRDQQYNGSWFYSKTPSKVYKQIDFHQGFILEGLFDFISYIEPHQAEVMNALIKGIKFYRNQQFLSDGRCKWRWPRIWPIDIHNQAQAIITFTRLSALETSYFDFAKTIAKWTIGNMQDKSGYFYYQKWSCLTNKIPYMRWSQAWMLYALTLLLSRM